MGSEFVRKAAPSFRKSWDKARVKLATADLLTQEPDGAVRTASADIVDGERVATGERLTVEMNDGILIARRDHSIVAKFIKPVPSLVGAVEASCGIAKGTVEQVYPDAGVVEISLC